jgi:hypothetical protein
VKCYSYGNIEHMSWECLQRKNTRGGEAHISKAQKEECRGIDESRSNGRRKIAHDEEISCQTREKGKRTSLEEQFVHNCLQD